MIDDNSKEFIKRHIGPSEEDQSKMLQYVGYKSLEDLMSNTVPEKILLKDIFHWEISIFFVKKKYLKMKFW